MDSLSPSEDRPLSFFSAAIWTLIALILDLLLLAITEAGREGAFFDLVSRTACEALAYSIVFFGILRLHEPETSIRHVLALRAPSVLVVIFALAVGAALSLPSEALDQALDLRFPRPAVEKEALDRLLSVATVGRRVALVVTTVVLLPAFEELFYRGALFTPLRRTRGAESVILGTALLETLASLSPRTMLSLLGATLVFAWIRASSGSIFPSIAARMAYYGVVIVPMGLAREPPKPTKTLLIASAAVAVLGLLGIFAVGRRRARLLAAEHDRAA